jgi:hypothetical protein
MIILNVNCLIVHKRMSINLKTEWLARLTLSQHQVLHQVLRREFNG